MKAVPISSCFGHSSPTCARPSSGRATQTGPAFLSQSARYGALAAGKAADILLLDASPLDDIANTRRIRMVVTQGRALDRAALDGMLASARAQAAR